MCRIARALSGFGTKVFFHGYRARDGALREIRLGARSGPQLLSRIRCAYAYAIEHGGLPDDFMSPTLGVKDWLQKWADYLDALTARNVLPLRAA